LRNQSHSNHSSNGMRNHRVCKCHRLCHDHCSVSQSCTSARSDRRNPSVSTDSSCSTKCSARHQGCDRSCGSQDQIPGNQWEFWCVSVAIDSSTAGTVARCASLPGSLCSPFRRPLRRTRRTRPVLACRIPSVTKNPSCSTRCLARHQGCGKNCAHLIDTSQDRDLDNCAVYESVLAEIDGSIVGIVYRKLCGPGSRGTLSRRCRADARRKHSHSQSSIGGQEVVVVVGPSSSFDQTTPNPGTD
jgi:hypothetical protein